MQDSTETSRGIRPGVFFTILAVMAILCGAIVFGKKKPSASEKSAAESQIPVENPAPASAVTTPGPPRPAPIAVKPPVRSGAPPAPGLPATLPPQTAVPTEPSIPQLTNWEQRIDAVLGSDEIDEARKADALLAMLPTLPEDGQLEAVQHISNLLPDERYPSIAPILTNALSSEPVLEALLTDLLNRPDALKLPTLLQLARIPDHPKAGEARDVLEVYVEENFGTDWAKWDGAIQKFLRENAE
jgi:hypothetical protein